MNRQECFGISDPLLQGDEKHIAFWWWSRIIPITRMSSLKSQANSDTVESLSRALGHIASSVKLFFFFLGKLPCFGNSLETWESRQYNNECETYSSPPLLKMGVSVASLLPRFSELRINDFTY